MPSPGKFSRETAHLPRLIALSPAPCRMLYVAVYHDEKAGTDEVRWDEVVGVLCVVETEYVQGVPERADYPSPGATHAEMMDRGWKSNHPPNWFPDVWPVVAGNNASDEYPLRVLHTRSGMDERYSTILVCRWPVEEDRERAIAAGRELLRTCGELSSNWAELTPAREPVDQEAG